jgi:ATP-dependent Clp protease ATP-binding subunit ClpA
LIAELFGLPDWNTLAAAIQRGAPASTTDATERRRANIVWPSGFTRELDLTLDRAIAHARERKHEFATLEHLLLALLDDPDASAAMRAGEVDLQALRQAATTYIDEKLKTWVMSRDERDTTPTVAFRRVVHLATVRSLKRETSSLDVLTSMFREAESPAVWLLSEQGMSQEKLGTIASRHGPQQGKSDSRRAQSPFGTNAKWLPHWLVFSLNEINSSSEF